MLRCQWHESDGCAARVQLLALQAALQGCCEALAATVEHNAPYEEALERLAEMESRYILLFLHLATGTAREGSAVAGTRGATRGGTQAHQITSVAHTAYAALGCIVLGAVLRRGRPHQPLTSQRCCPSWPAAGGRWPRQQWVWAGRRGRRCRFACCWAY